MERLTKKNPETNLERLLNFAIAEDKQVVLDYGFEKKPLVQVVAEKAKSMDCDATEQAVMYEGQCMECDCAVALMNMLGIQAAELHARLSLIEDILGNVYDLDRLRELVQADQEGRCVVLPCDPGQVVWAANSFGVSSHQIRMLARDKDGDFACSMIKFPLEDFGRKVFLTREEAEAALRREQDG